MRKLPLILPAVLLAVAVLACGGRSEKVTPEPKPTLTYSGGTAGSTQKQTATATARTAEAPTADTSVGAKMPAYAAQTLDGKPFDLASDRGSDVVFLNVWATWCSPCVYEIPELVKMHDQHAARGFKVIGVSIDEGAPEPVRDFVKAKKMTYPVVLDAEGKLANLLQTTVLPTSVLIDRAGTIVWRHFGLVDPADPALKKALDLALAQPATTAAAK